MENKRLSILSLNIGNPSLERAQRQISWLNNRPEDIFVLTETKNSKGCSYLADYYSGIEVSLFQSRPGKYNVLFPKSLTGDLGTMIVSKFPILDKSSVFSDDSVYFSREVTAHVSAWDTNIFVTGVYVPSRDTSEEKISRKRSFIEAFSESYCLSQSDVIIGDFNIVEPGHIPHYSTFHPWEYGFYNTFIQNGYVDAFRMLYPNQNEYSWVGRTNNGYRYDLCFVSHRFANTIIDCNYIHESRFLKLTDHSAISVSFDLSRENCQHQTLFTPPHRPILVEE